MFTNILIVLPIFALILTGWIARKTGALGPNATREVNRLVVYLALPAVLFDIVANAKLADIWEPGFTLAFAGGCFIIFGATLWWRVSSGHALADAAIDGLNASYANTGFVGFPLVLSLVGDRGMAPTLVATLVTVCALFATAITLIEAGLQTENRRRDIVRKTLFSLAKNPLLIAPVLGALVMLSGSHLPGPVHVFLKLLGGADHYMSGSRPYRKKSVADGACVAAGPFTQPAPDPGDFEPPSSVGKSGGSDAGTVG